MDYTYPDYYRQFHCIASSCEDTCCAVWGIAIDDPALNKYRNYPGKFGRRLRTSIDWKNKTFRQQDHRCAFLNDEDLCDLHIEGGNEFLCKTCRRYPRHYEEYENLREVSLSMSCPEAARLILGHKDKTVFLESTKETPEEEYESFDFLLFTKLTQIREIFLKIAQNREMSISHRMAWILSMAHDLQIRIKDGRLYEIDSLLDKFQTDEFMERMSSSFEIFEGKWEYRKAEMQTMWNYLYQLEELKADWQPHLKELEEILYGQPQDLYAKNVYEFRCAMQEREYEFEQILVYFLFTYLCGAVYDEDLYSKVKLAIVSTMLIEEIDMAAWIKNGKIFRFEDQVNTAHDYSREVEHSDLNMESMERFFKNEQTFSLMKMLYGLC